MSNILRVLLCAAFLTLGAGVASAHHVQCSRDINYDGKDNRKDMKIIEDAMGTKVGVGPYDERADLDRDGMVNEADREAYLHCTPSALLRDKSRRK